MPDFPSSSEIYDVEHADVMRVFDAVPKAHRRKPRILKALIREALAELSQDTRRFECLSAPDYLIGRILAYCASGECRDPYFRELTTWLRDGGWDEPKSAWVSRRDRAENAVVESQERYSERQRREQKNKWRLGA